VGEGDTFADVGGNKVEAENTSIDLGGPVSRGRDTVDTGV
jgi:hypothetical protein